MFVIRKRLISVTKNVLNSKFYVPSHKTRFCTVINTPNFSVSKVYFSDKPKLTEHVATPLTTLISKDGPQQKKENVEDEEAKRVRESSWRTMKYTLFLFGTSITCLGVYLVFELGQPRLTEKGEMIEDEFTKMPTFKQYLFRTIQAVHFYIKLLEEPSRDKLLPDTVTFPYYQPPYTLVLELTDVLVHPDWTYKTGWRFKKRPGIQRFLEMVSPAYEIVIYTAEQGMTVFPIIEVLDPNNLISYKLVRDATHFVHGHHVKSLDKLNRDLSKVIVVDWNPKSVKFHPENALQIPRWSGNDNDNTLFDLLEFLKAISDAEIEDVREVLRHYSVYPDPLLAFKERQKMFIDEQEKERELRVNQNPSVLSRWTPSFLRKNPSPDD